MSPEINTSGGRVIAKLKKPSAIGAKPHQRQRPSQIASQRPPNEMRPSASDERLGTRMIAPGHDVTV